MKKRRCSKCKEYKPVSMFVEDHRYKTGFNSYCKDCNTSYYTKNKNKDYTVVRGIMHKLYRVDKVRIPFNMLFEILNNLGFEDLYNKWKSSGYEKHKKPTLIKINPDKAFSVGNMELVTREYLVESGKSVNSNKNIVCQIDKTTGAIVKEYDNTEVAGRMTKVHVSAISRVCRGIRKSAGGYYWEYKNKSLDNM